MPNQKPYRIGSPFAATTPHASLPTSFPAGITAAGPSVAVPAAADWPLADHFAHVATAAAIAAGLLVAFAAVCWAWFPAGGIAVTALGAAMSLVAMRSRRQWLAVCLLVVHGALFWGCYLAAI